MRISIGHFLLALCHRFMLLVARCVMILPEAHAMGKRKATHDHSVCVCVCAGQKNHTRIVTKTRVLHTHTRDAIHILFLEQKHAKASSRASERACVCTRMTSPFD